MMDIAINTEHLGIFATVIDFESKRIQELLCDQKISRKMQYIQFF